MAKVKVKRGAKMICVPCGREVVVSNCGISRTTLWCCGTPMKKKTSAILKRIKGRSREKKR